uniref:Uncharacterized protein n=1 Tax=Lepeophtheirus salmonis TaxID=72036 RepID=A0A0K2SVD0_LEPSM
MNRNISGSSLSFNPRFSILDSREEGACLKNLVLFCRCHCPQNRFPQNLKSPYISKPYEYPSSKTLLKEIQHSE